MPSRAFAPRPAPRGRLRHHDRPAVRATPASGPDEVARNMETLARSARACGLPEAMVREMLADALAEVAAPTYRRFRRLERFRAWLAAEASDIPGAPEFSPEQIEHLLDEAFGKRSGD